MKVVVSWIQTEEVGGDMKVVVSWI